VCVCAIFSSYIIDLYRTFVDCYHRLNGDISLLWECQKFDPHRMETPDTIEIKNGTVDYVGEMTRGAKFH